MWEFEVADISIKGIPKGDILQEFLYYLAV